MRLSRRHFALSAATVPFIVPAIGHSQATPDVRGFDHSSARFLELLQFVPGCVFDENLNVMWNDIERHLASVLDHAGAAAEEQSEDQLAFRSLYAAGSVFLSWAHELEPITGYAFAEVRQTVEFGNPPEAGLLVQLDTPADSLIPFWESQDYEPLENEFGKFWSLDEEPRISFDHPIQRRMMARLNNVAILQEDLVVYATSSEILRQIMSTASGDSPNRVAELEDIVAGFPEDATSAWFMDGGILEFGAVLGSQLVTGEPLARVQDMLAESDDAVGTMPIIRTLCVGATAGGHLNEELHNSNAREFLVLETSRFNMAEQAARVARWRIDNLYSLNTGQPYSELLVDPEFDVLDGEHLRISVPLPIPRAMLVRLIQDRDILPFTFMWGQ